MIYRDITPEQLAELIRQAVQAELARRVRRVPVGVSVRHVHLCRQDVERLYGPGYQLTPKKKLSQPGQFACEEQVTVVGPKGKIEKVRILGPERKESQVEMAFSDCRVLGLDAPVRPSGRIDGTPGCTLIAANGRQLELSRGVIIADRHLHLSTAQADAFGLKDGDIISIQVDGVKPGVMEHVTVRAGDSYEMDFHIDTDDANAFQLKQGQWVSIKE